MTNPTKGQTLSPVTMATWTTARRLSDIKVVLFVLALTLLSLPADGQTPVALAQCRRDCYSSYLKLHQRYCPLGTACNYTNYTAQYYLGCYRACNEQQRISAPPTTPSPTRVPPPPPQEHCGLSTVPRSVVLPPADPIQANVVNGRLAGECEFPWTVVVFAGSTFCGGSIIDKNTILTAGHCVFSQSGGLANPSVITVKYGSSDQTKAKTTYVKRVETHLNFTLRNYDYDVALLTLVTSLPYDQCTAPICLPAWNSAPPSTCMAAGWGALSYSQPSSQRDLRVVSLPIIGQDDCRQAYSGSTNITDIKLCAGDLLRGGIDSCLGDSGGPLMCSVDGAYVLYGSVSFGRGCASPGSPGVYARIAHPTILDWVRQRSTAD